MSQNRGPVTRPAGSSSTARPRATCRRWTTRPARSCGSTTPAPGVVGSPITWEQDGEQYVAVTSGWGGAVPLWGGDVAKIVKNFNQGGSIWAFKLVD